MMLTWCVRPGSGPDQRAPMIVIALAAALGITWPAASARALQAEPRLAPREDRIPSVKRHSTFEISGRASRSSCFTAVPISIRATSCPISIAGPTRSMSSTTTSGDVGDPLTR
jgi:hypothetical protein